MSWSEAKTVADAVFRDLSVKHDPGFVRMVIRALERQLNADEKAKHPTKIKSLAREE